MNSTKPAGFGIRFLASIIDFLIISSILGIIYYIINGNYSIEWTNEFTFRFFYTLYLTIIPILWGGYIIGKRICKIKIKRFKDDKNVTLLNMVMREVVGNYIVVLATFGVSVLVSGLMVIFRKDKRGIHDFIGGTYVSRE
ncbi:RDD family protein [Psychrobacillus sp. FSL H8-0483]|uniref:RDD family protein n=1 Tax=Psychrobacillus sp. FSL H8-0483 TaxID=2921389 RepID=UPI00315AB0FF